MAKRTFTSSKVKIGATSYNITNLKMDTKTAKVDVTDTGTLGDGKEYVFGRTDRTFQFDMWNNGAMIPVGAAPVAIELDFQGVTYSASGSLESCGHDAQIDGAIKSSYQGAFVGAVTETVTP